MHDNSRLTFIRTRVLYTVGIEYSVDVKVGLKTRFMSFMWWDSSCKHYVSKYWVYHTSILFLLENKNARALFHCPLFLNKQSHFHMHVFCGNVDRSGLVDLMSEGIPIRLEHAGWLKAMTLCQIVGSICKSPSITPKSGLGQHILRKNY